MRKAVLSGGGKRDIMNNEEKILELLARHENSFEKINQTLIELIKGQEEMRADIAELKATVDELDQRSIRTQVLLETEIRDNIQLLFDGHKTILETLAPKSRVDALEDDVSFMKTVIKAMSQEIEELKKAQ